MQEVPLTSTPHVILAWRPDIDGLRAVAVLLVITYHAFPRMMPGGFVGVDIFFVISGFLISSIIIKNLKDGTFTFRDFYARRILRIFPALSVVLASCLAGGWLMLLPDEFEELGKQIFGGAAFMDNFLFWHESGYFDVAAKVKPLLMLWSLGIEEQYYFFFPLFLWALFRHRFRLATGIALLLVLSFQHSVWLRHRDPTADFYSPLARMWELLAGAFLGCLHQSKVSEAVHSCVIRLDTFLKGLLYEDFSPASCVTLRFACACLGLLCLVVGVLRAGRGIPWPGWQAMWPVLGTCLIIAAGPHTLISRLLSFRVPVFIGKISYPLYLWHWPLLSFAFIIHGPLEANTRLLRLGLVGISFLLAVLTCFFVEKPLRFSTHTHTHTHTHTGKARPKIIGLCLTMTLLAGCGLWTACEKGFPERAKFRQLAAVLEDIVKRPAPYSPKVAEAYFEADKIRNLVYAMYDGQDAPETVCIVGDSHAYFAFSGVSELGQKKYNTAMLGWWVPGGHIWDPSRAWQRERIVTLISEHPDIKKVFLFICAKIYFEPIVPNRELIPPEVFVADLQDMVSSLRDMKKEVFIVVMSPWQKVDIKDIVERGLFGVAIKKDYPRTTLADALAWQAPYLDLLSRIKGATIIDTVPTFCRGGECRILSDDGLPFYVDVTHLSRNGSLFQAREILWPYLEQDLQK